MKNNILLTFFFNERPATLLFRAKIVYIEPKMRKWISKQFQQLVFDTKAPNQDIRIQCTKYH